MGASNSTPEPPYTGMVYAPKRTFDITSTHGKKLAGVYEIRENGLPHYCTNFTRARRGINISTIHRLEDDGRPGETLAAFRGHGHWHTRYGVMLGDPFVKRKTKVDRQGNPIPWAKDKKQWQKIRIGSAGSFGWMPYKVVDRRYIGNADKKWAHWALVDEDDKSKQILAVYVHIVGDDEHGQLRVAQLNLYAPLGPDVEISALAIMEGMEKLRGPEAIVYESPAIGGPSC
ncbi:hypothetical protein Slin14017_G060880 [Septoria linicola]|nr:hypothetical protein Slin14017_G060880 [Septoria linicola]